MIKLLLFVSLYLCIFASSVKASDYYTQTQLTTRYTTSGESQSRLQLTLRNLDSHNYPISLKVNLHGDKINLLSAKDDYGDVPYIYTYQPSGINTISVTFNRRMVGKNVLSHLYLTYQGPHADRSENTWVISFPKIDISQPADFIYQITVPNHFGRLIAAQTLPQTKSSTSEDTTYLLKGKSIDFPNRLIFGESYPFSFALTYPPSTQIVLPKDTPQQKIYLTNLSPLPKLLKLQDNSWVAHFSAPDSAITVSGYAVFFQNQAVLEIPKLTDFSQPTQTLLSPHPYQYLPTKPVSLSLRPPKQFWPFFTHQIFVDIYNPNFQAMYNITANLSASGLSLLQSPSLVIQAIPPSGQVTVPISLKLPFSQLLTPKSLTFSLPDQQFSYNLSRSSLIIYYLVYCVLIALIFIGTLNFTLFTRRLLLQKRRRSSHLHRQS